MTGSTQRIQQLIKEVESLKKIITKTQDKHDELLTELKTAVRYLREGKAKFAPSTTNSFVDEFLKRHEELK